MISLASGAVPPFEVLAGDPDSPVLLHVPHAGTAVPGDVRARILLDDAALAAEVAALTDHDTDALAAAARTGEWMIVNRLSRFVVDPERLPGDREEMAAVGMAAVYTRGTRGQRLRDDDPVHAADLLARFHAPWAAAVEDLVARRIAATGRAVVVDVHSYPRDPLPYELRPGAPRPAFCLGTHPLHTPPALLAAARAAFGPDVAEDTPFAGCYVPLSRFGTDAQVQAIMIEVRRDVLAGAPDRLRAFLTSLAAG